MSVSEKRLKDCIEKADHDLGTAIIINKYIHDYSDTLAFHCQQAVEKYIKCLLEKHSIEYKRSHDLRYLLDLLENSISIDDILYDKIIRLNAFSVEIRYPDIKIDLSEDERNTAIETAKEFREILKENLDFSFD